MIAYVATRCAHSLERMVPGDGQIQEVYHSVMVEVGGTVVIVPVPGSVTLLFVHISYLGASTTKLQPKG